MACALFGAPTVADAQLGLGLAPMRIELRLAPGQEYSGALKLSSGSGERVRVRAEALDLAIDSTGTPQFEPTLPDEAGVSCGRWIELNPVETELDAYGSLTVRYTLRVPADVTPGSYACAAGVTTLPSIAADGSAIGMRMAVRIVSAFYIQIGSPAVKGQLKSIQVEPLPRGDAGDRTGWQAVVVVENQGLMYFRPTGTVDVLDETGSAVETIDFTPLPVLRQRDQRFVFPVKTELSGGHYKVRVRLDIGADEIQQGVADVRVAPEGDLADARIER
jgi:hypothetical protein